jgi:DNA-binding CsgD family transcriptional regulator
MAKTLFFIEAAALAALALLFPIIASEAAAAFILPLAASLILPLACSTAIWPPRAVASALSAAFSPQPPGRAGPESALILESLGSFSRSASVLGMLLSLIAILHRLPLAGSLRVWALLGIYLSLYALLNFVLWRILAAHATKLAESSRREGREAGEAFAERYGLTPRERETALLIAAGRSYKEAAFELAISIKTVKAHMGRVYEKTGAASNVSLSLILREWTSSGAKVL